MDIFSRLLGYFTYRQRFLITSVAYALCAPYPSYIAIETFQFWIRQLEWQQAGDTVQKQLNQVLNEISLHQERTGSQILEGGHDFKKVGLVGSIEDLWKGLSRSYSSGTGSTYILATGFSTLTEPSIDIISIQEDWNNLLSNENSLNFEENNQEHQQIVDRIKSELLKVGYSYALFQGTSPMTESYSVLLLDRLPDIQEWIKQLSIKRKRSQTQQQGQEIFKFEITALTQSINNELNHIEKLFYTYYQMLRQQSSYSYKEISKVKIAYENYVQIIRGFLPGAMSIENQLDEDIYDFSGIVEAKNELVDRLYQLQHPIFEADLRYNQILYYLFLIQFAISMFLLVVMSKYKAISSHLTELRDHIVRLSKGEMSHCFTSQENDEFGVIGKALDKVVDVIHIIIKDLESFAHQIKEISVRVGWAVREQEETLLEQEKIVVEGKKKAQDISERAVFLSNMLHDICESSQLTLHAKNAHSNLKKMGENMNFLIKVSKEFLVSFDSFAEEVQNTQKKVNFMDRLGDQAKMLSLNGKIENATITKSAGNFSEITSKIERFSDNSEEATSQIKIIIKEALSEVKGVKGEAKRCLSEIGSGVGQLSMVSRQLEEIAKLGETQQQKFLKVDEMMKIQATSSQNIIENMQNLLTPASENVILVKQIPKILGNIIEQQRKLIEVISKMVYKA